MDMRTSDGGSRYLGTKQLACNIIILIGTINDIYTMRSLNLDQFGSRSLRRPSSGSQSALQSLARSCPAMIAAPAAAASHQAVSSARALLLRSIPSGRGTP